MHSIIQISRTKVNAATSVPLLVDQSDAGQSAFLFVQLHVDVIGQAESSVLVKFSLSMR